MTRFISTINPPAAISFFEPVTTLQLSSPLMDERIRSAFEGAQRELTRYHSYQAHWDGYQAQPFSHDVLAGANAILNFSVGLFLNAGITPALVTTGPASDGSIDVELRVAEKGVLMTLYPEEGQVRVSRFDAEGAHEDTEPVGEQTVERLFDWLRQSAVVPDRLGTHRDHS
jgi:hypothetical protein